MALSMTSPTKHPKSGVYRVRQAIPPHLRSAAQHLFGKSTEFIESLNTKDAADAKRRAPPAVAKFQWWIDAAARDLLGKPGNPPVARSGNLLLCTTPAAPATKMIQLSGTCTRDSA